MRTVKSRSALNKQAISKGATVTDKKGVKFNSGKKVKSNPMLAKKTAAPKVEKPNNEKLLIEAIAASDKNNTALLIQLKEQVAMLQLNSPEPIQQWVFDIVRDNKGYIKQIKASVPARSVN